VLATTATRVFMVAHLDAGATSRTAPALGTSQMAQFHLILGALTRLQCESDNDRSGPSFRDY
jgi:hypothetical protein